MVHLTVAAKLFNGSDYRVDPQSALAKKLREAIDLARDTRVTLQIDSYLPLFFKIKAEILVDPTYMPEKVIPAVKNSVQAAYAFEARRFSQPVTQSEVMAVLQGVPGVKAAFLKNLYLNTALSATLENFLESPGAKRR